MSPALRSDSRSENPEEAAGPSRGRRALGLALSPVAGLCHLLVLERFFRGTLLAAGFVLGSSLVLAGSLAWTGPGSETLRVLGFSLVALTVALSVGDAVLWLLLVDHGRRVRRRDSAFRQGLAHSLRGETEEAIGCLREALQLDPRQSAMRFHLGIALWRARRLRAARRQLRRCIRWDPDRVWEDEVRRALAEMEPARRARSRR